jgi:hypothetical protein
MWVPNATKGGGGAADAAGGVARELVNFTSNAEITDAAKSDRAQRLAEETR